jgi:hypothetical protein
VPPPLIEGDFVTLVSFDEKLIFDERFTDAQIFSLSHSIEIDVSSIIWALLRADYGFQRRLK